MDAWQIADRAIEAYDAYVFASVGRSFDSAKADMLALDAADECRVAALCAHSEWDANYYTDRHVEFQAIAT